MPRFKYRTLAQQERCMLELYPDFKCSRKGNLASWRGRFRPFDSSPSYSIFIEYDLNRNPRVWIKEPKINLTCKHIYPEDESLCLYYPKENEWTNKMFIGETIVPWTAEWLAFYEIWMKTGIWYGKEAPHGKGKKSQ